MDFADIIRQGPFDLRDADGMMKLLGAITVSKDGDKGNQVDTLTLILSKIHRRSPGVVKRYNHDCEQCVFLGHYQEFDLYACCKSRPTIVARYGEKPEENSSGILGQPELIAGMWLALNYQELRLVPPLTGEGPAERLAPLIDEHKKNFDCDFKDALAGIVTDIAIVAREDGLSDDDMQQIIQKGLTVANELNDGPEPKQEEEEKEKPTPDDAWTSCPSCGPTLQIRFIRVDFEKNSKRVHCDECGHEFDVSLG